MSFEVELVAVVVVPIVVQPIWVRIGQLKCTSGIQFDKIVFDLHKLKFSLVNFSLSFFLYCVTSSYPRNSIELHSLYIFLFIHSLKLLLPATIRYCCPIFCLLKTRLREAPCTSLLSTSTRSRFYYFTKNSLFF